MFDNTSWMKIFTFKTQVPKNPQNWGFSEIHLGIHKTKKREFFMREYLNIHTY